MSGAALMHPVPNEPIPLVASSQKVLEQRVQRDAFVLGRAQQASHFGDVLVTTPETDATRTNGPKARALRHHQRRQGDQSPALVPQGVHEEPVAYEPAILTEKLPPGHQPIVGGK